MRRGENVSTVCPRAKNLSLAGLLVAWLCANGAVWDAVQVFAWGRMFAGNAGNMSAATALRATFNPAQRCPLCLRVAKARDVAQKQAPLPVERSAGKVLLACDRPATIVFANTLGDWPPALASAAPTRTEPVPVPPPRV